MSTERNTSFAVELTKDEVEFLKDSLGLEWDSEVRVVVESIVKNAIGMAMERFQGIPITIGEEDAATG